MTTKSSSALVPLSHSIERRHRRSQEPQEADGVVALLWEAQLGDQAACERLFAELRPHAVRAAGAFLRDVPTAVVTAEDVAHEALFRAYANLESCRATADGHVLAWLRTITQRLTIEVLRAHALRVSLDGVGLYEDSGCAEDTMACGTLSVGEAEQVFLKRLTYEAYEALGDSSAEAVWMHLICSASWEEVGRALDITAAAAKRRFQRAQIAIRRRVLRRVGELSAADRALVQASSEKRPLAI